MVDKTAMPAAPERDEAFLDDARAAWEARLAEARGDARAAAWAERTADALVERLVRRSGT